MSGGVSGAGARRAIDEFDAALDDAAKAGTTSGEKISKREMREALTELDGVRLTKSTREKVWAKIEEHKLVPTARKLAEDVLGPAPAAASLPKEGPKLATHLETLAKDLTFMSESDYPYDAFSSPLPNDRPLTDAALWRAFGVRPGTELDKRDLAEWFQDQKDPAVHDDAAERAKYAALEAAMKAGLRDPQLIYVGPEDQVEAKVYLVGRAPDGSITGLSSTRIWT